MSEVDFLIFPIRNEDGFLVRDWEAYRHMIRTIVGAQLELTKDYPNQHVLVTYVVEPLGEGDD